MSKSASLTKTIIVMTDQSRYFARVCCASLRYAVGFRRRCHDFSSCKTTSESRGNFLEHVDHALLVQTFSTLLSSYPLVLWRKCPQAAHAAATERIIILLIATGRHNKTDPCPDETNSVSLPRRQPGRLIIPAMNPHTRN